MSSQPKRTKRPRQFENVFIDTGAAIYDAPQLPAAYTHRHTEAHSDTHMLNATHQSYYTTPASPKKTGARPNPGLLPSIDWIPEDSARIEDPDAPFPFDFMDPDHVFEVADMMDEPSRRKRGAGDYPLLMWIPETDDFVAEIIRLEGRGAVLPYCPQCGESANADHSPDYRCADCQDIRLLCLACLLANHQVLPFHRVTKWNGSYFSKISLRDIGLRVQLGHPHGEGCTNPVACDPFVVVHTTAIHTISLDFCACGTSAPHSIQLLRARLFPATVVRPQTAATFDVLDAFQMLTFMSKISAYEFYHTLARSTDNTGVHPVPDRYHAFLRMVREWRHVMMLKRGGRGHDPRGVKATSKGECAVICPACPYPEFNLPADWRARSSGNNGWIYSLFIAMDANFRLKRLAVSNDQRDPGLNHGYAYVVEEREFKNYLVEYGDMFPDEVSTCNNHDALKSASSRGGKGISSSGVGTVECARHDMKRPVSVGDLQKGERYVNMDFFFMSSLGAHETPNRVVLSYDIACQYSVNLQKRLDCYPASLRPHQRDDDYTFVIPKFHLPAHQESCRTGYSFNYTPHVANTDGEAPERGWSGSNALASSTKEMGPGHRRDILDDTFGDYNWRKVTLLPSTLLRKIKEAVTGRAEHTLAFEQFNAGLDEDVTCRWVEMVEAWEKNNSQPNPFKRTERAITIDKVRLALAREDAAAPANEGFLHAEVSPTVMIAQGLDLEEHQRRLRIEASRLGLHATDKQRAKLLEKENSLRRRIEAWYGIQALYVPHVVRLRSLSDQQEGESLRPFAWSLFLPSAIVNQVPCEAILQRTEWRLRLAQAYDHLESLRQHLLLKTQLYKYKDRFVRGQRYNTRSNAVITNIMDKIDADAARYRIARAALVALAVPLQMIGWQRDIRILDETDVKGLGEEDSGESRRTISWIWISSTTGDSQDEARVAEALRIEWCKARARAHRWSEECTLLEEEMRRVIQFNSHMAATWRARAKVDGFKDMRSAAVEGRIAYASRQAAIRDDLVRFCQRTWQDVPRWLALKADDDEVLDMIDGPVSEGQSAAADDAEPEIGVV